MKVSHEDSMRKYRETQEAKKKLPLCGMSYEGTPRKAVWWVEGMEGHFRYVAKGEKENCVHAIDTRSRRAVIVSLQPATKEEVTKLIFGARS